MSKQLDINAALLVVTFSFIFLFSLPLANAISWTSPATVNTNSSEYWVTNLGSLDDANSTQFENNAQTLNIDLSWLTTFGDSEWCELTGCTMGGDINMGSNDILGVNDLTVDNDATITDELTVDGGIKSTDVIEIWGNYYLKWLDNAGANTYAYIIANIAEFRLSAVSEVPMNFYYGNLGSKLGASMNGVTGNWNFTNNVTANDFFIPEMKGNNGYGSLNDAWNLFTSAGRLTNGTIYAGAGTTVIVSEGQGVLRIADDDISQVKFIGWDESAAINVPTDSIMYFGVEYNGGSPRIVNKTDYTLFDLDTDFPLGSAINQDGEIYILNNPWWVGDGLTNVIERFQAEGWLERDENLGGLIIGYTGTRNPTMSAGTLWSRLTEFAIPDFNSATGDTFDYYYRDGAGGYSEFSDQTQWNITHWDDGTGTLNDIGNNQYAVIWVWVNAGSEKISLMYPQATYSNAASAEAEEIPNTFPSIWYKGGIIAGRIIIQEGMDAPVEVQSVFTQTFTAAQAADHGNLAGLTDDDHSQYLLTNGSRALSGNWDMGAVNYTNQGTRNQLGNQFWVCQLTPTSNTIMTSNLTKSIEDGKC